MTKKRFTVFFMIVFFTSVIAVFAGGKKEVANEKPIVLTFMTWDYSDKTNSTDAFIQAVKDKFNVEIDLMNIPTDQYETTLKTKLVANDLPDLVQVHRIGKNYDLYGSIIDPGLFVDISNLDSISKYIPSVIENTRKAGGELYNAPISTNVLGALYNKDVFKTNGIEIPKNINELQVVLEKLKASGITPISAGFKDAWTTQIIPLIAYGQFINSKDLNTRIKLAEGKLKYADIKDDFTKVLTVQQNFIKKGYFQKDYLGTDADYASVMVATGKAAMTINGTWQYIGIQNANPDAHIGFFALPLNAQGKELTSSSVSEGGICINSSSKHVDLAKKVLDYYLSAENQTRVMDDLNGISTNLDVKVASPFVNEVSDVLSSTKVLPDFWGAGSYYRPPTSTFDVPVQLQALVAGETTIDQFIAEYDRLNAKALAE